MFQYLILQHPGHNRVYYLASVEMALAELELCCQQFSSQCSKFELIELAGVNYLSFNSETPIAPEEIHALSNLSFAFALFQFIKDGEEYSLKPLHLHRLNFVDTKISSLLKYQGKTNELFTRMMINMAIVLYDNPSQQRLRLLDPVAGKGTTLFEALTYGLDAYGVEIEGKSVHEAEVYFKKFLQEERWKFNTEKRQVSGANKSKANYMQHFQFAANKESFKDKQSIQQFGIVHGDTTQSASYFKKDYFHIMVGDLPYGIVHGNKSSTASRNPSELIEQSAGQWHTLLRKGGIGILSWNVNVASKHKLSQIFTAAGFDVLNDELYQRFEHRVDQSIIRDIIIIRK